MMETKIVNIENEEQYRAIAERFEKLALSIQGNVPKDKSHPVHIEMRELGLLLEVYDEEYYPIDEQ